MLQHWDRQFRASRRLVGIYHYMGHSLRMDEDDLRDTIFYDYYVKTPWIRGKTICYMFGKLERIYLNYMERKLAFMRIMTAVLATKKLVIAASSSKEEKVLELLKTPEKFDLKATYPTEIKIPTYLMGVKNENKKEPQKKVKTRHSVIPDNITYFNLGDDKKLNLNLPYDVDEYFYLFFVEDYIKVRVMLEEAGLKQDGHYMDGNFLIEDIIEGGFINPNKLVDML